MNRSDDRDLRPIPGDRTTSAARKFGNALLERDIRNWVAAWNENPKPFIWTKTAEQILESIARLLKRINGAGH